MAHRNAPLTPEGRRRLCQRVDAGRPICHVAAEAGVARQTLAKWHARWKADGPAGLQDRSSRPVSSPGQVDAQVEDVVEYLRRHLKLGPVMLAAELREFGITLAPSTIHRVLVRRGISRLRDLDVTGQQHLNLAQPLPDPDDEHVFATAVAGAADAIATFNTKDFPADVAADLGIEIRHPDQFLVNVIDLDPARALKALRMQREALKNPPMNVESFLDKLRGAGLLQSHLRLGGLAGLL